MKPLCTLIIVVIFALTLILSLEVNVAKARTYPSSSNVSKMLSSFQSLSHKKGSSKSSQEVSASLKRIPPSRPNPTQNKLKPRIKD
ncbi:hypothetical protein MtrunA17_Chr8g0354971 [Medicago truncatula]|uniref:Clavata3/ESR (CLE) gene family member n=1 Tax=Medicago truncatula TaxID=3880 RepID=A0A072TPS4_MEDTR|nr:Clavata3/ESR (CLE) gene family member [Medicago truncatula]RHN40461.1 hypothetical protein MtrunA17_Chr8g0354971 [Medicago truncatula]